MEMNLYNRYNHHDNKTAAFRMTRALGMTYVDDLDEKRSDAETKKSNIFVATDVAGVEQVVSVNLYPQSFLNGKFRWTQSRWQGLTMPAGLFAKKPEINMFAQIDGNDELIAFAARENFGTKEEERGGVKSRIAKEFNVMNTLTGELWYVNVLTGVYEKI